MLRTAFASFAAVAVKSASGSNPQSNAKESLICRPSDLPIYSTLRKQTSKLDVHAPKDSALHDHVENGVRYVRKELQSGYTIVADQAGIITDYLETAKAHTQQSIDFLNEPQNSLHRSGAIVMGGLAGFIFAARGGLIKRIIYTGIGAGAVASLCYPRQAEENARVVLYEGRKIFAVAYNFIKGVKPGEEVSIEPIKKFPTSLEDLKFLALDFVDEAKGVLFPKNK